MEPEPGIYEITRHLTLDTDTSLLTLAFDGSTPKLNHVLPDLHTKYDPINIEIGSYIHDINLHLPI